MAKKLTAKQVRAVRRHLRRIGRKAPKVGSCVPLGGKLSESGLHWKSAVLVCRWPKGSKVIWVRE